MAERPDDPSSEARELAGQLGEIDAFAHLDSLQLLEIASNVEGDDLFILDDQNFSGAICHYEIPSFAGLKRITKVVPSSC